MESGAAEIFSKWLNQRGIQGQWALETLYGKFLNPSKVGGCLARATECATVFTVI